LEELIAHRGIKITFSSGILFDVDKANLKDGPKAELAELSSILNKYADTKFITKFATNRNGRSVLNGNHASLRRLPAFR
jgi:hypothetical protein